MSDVILNDLLSNMTWCDVPAGSAVVTRSVPQGTGRHAPMQKVTETVSTVGCTMSRSAVTNVHFQKFLDDPNGYSNLEWWRFDDKDLKKRKLPPRDPVGGDNDPRTHVDFWAVCAYAQWLSAQVGEVFRVPMEGEWRVAVQNKDDLQLSFDQQEWFISTFKTWQDIPHVGRGKAIRYGKTATDSDWTASRKAAPEGRSSKACGFRLVRTGIPFEAPKQQTIDVDGAIEAIQSGQKKIIKQGMEDLRIAQDSKAIPVLIELLQSDTMGTYMSAIATLKILAGKHGDAIPAEPIIDIVINDHRNFARDAQDLLELLTSDEQRAAIIKATEHENETMRYRLAEPMRKNLDADVLPIFEKLLETETVEINRYQYVEQAKWVNNDDEAKRKFLESVMLNTDEVERVRFNAAKAVSKMGHSASHSAFEQLRDSDSERLASIAKQVVGN